MPSLCGCIGTVRQREAEGGVHRSMIQFLNERLLNSVTQLWTVFFLAIFLNFFRKSVQSVGSCSPARVFIPQPLKNRRQSMLYGIALILSNSSASAVDQL